VARPHLVVRYLDADDGAAVPVPAARAARAEAERELDEQDTQARSAAA
jgi:hypothetical protein